MKHFGDITKIHGYDVPIVDVITGGSPCQDLSVAGKRAGLAGERSGLFMEQIRIVKEMRDYDRANGRTDEHIRPRYMVWENVPGAFSSNGGKDFHAVLEETAKVAERDACIPGFEGKWPSAGCIMGNGWSIAWRVHDAQFWGVPQRRKRISLIADFGGDTAPEILFERKSVSGDTAQSGKEGEGTSGGVERCTDPSSYTLKIRGGVERDSSGKKAGKGPLVQTELSGTLGVSQDQTLITNVIGFNRERCGAVTMDDAMPTLQAAAGESGNNKPMVCLNDQGGQQMSVTENVSGTLRAQEHGHQPIVYSVDQGAGKSSCQIDVETAPTLATTHDGAPAVVYGISSYESNSMKSSNPNSGIYEAETARTLDLNGGSPACNQGGVAVVQTYQQTTGSLCASGYDKLGTQEAANDMYVVCKTITGDDVTPTLVSRISSAVGNTQDNLNVITYGLDRAAFNQGANAQYDFRVEEEKIGTQVAKGPGAVCQSVVRRLTPMECERLQGYPDHWTDIGEWVDSKGKTHKDADSPRYKALGNSIALPFWAWMAERMVKYLEPGCTMASLFDGIGGFPLVFSACGCEPVWASEIEEFPIAVTKKRFPEC